MIKSREVTGFLTPHAETTGLIEERIEDVNNEYIKKMREASIEVKLNHLYYDDISGHINIEYELTLPIAKDIIFFDVSYEPLNGKGYYEFFLFTGNFEMNEEQAQHLFVYLIRAFMYEVPSSAFRDTLKRMMTKECLVDELVQIESHDKVIVIPE